MPASPPQHTLLEKFRSDRRRLPLHPREKAVLIVVALHLCFLPWALGTMHVWSQLTSLALSIVGMTLALTPRTYTGDYLPAMSPQVSGLSSQVSGHGPAMRLTMWPRLVKFPIFWLGLALLAYIAVQGFNPSWVWERNATTWWLRRVNDIPWLPTSVDTPFERFDSWRQLIIYASAWLTVCTIWTGFTRRRALHLLLFSVLGNGLMLGLVGLFQKFAGLDSFLFIMKWPEGNTAFASFIYRNHAGAYFGLLTFLAVGLAIWSAAQGARMGRKSSPTSLIMFAAVLLTAAVFFSLSRGAILLVGVMWPVCFLWFLLYRRQQPAAGHTHPAIQTAVVLLFAVVIGSSARYVDFSSISDRFEYLRKYYNTKFDSVQSRIQAHSAAESMLDDHWQRGVGSGGFRFLFPEYIKKYPDVYSGGRLFWEHAHNDWLEIPIELGVAGTLLLLWGAGYWLQYFYRVRPVWHPLVVPVLLGCGQTLVHAWFDFPFQCPAILTTWLALVAISTRWMELDAS